MANMVPSKSKQATLKDILEKAKPSMLAVLPKHITADRLIKVALSATARKPELLACTSESLLRAVFQGAELGLEAGGLLGEGYIVPMGRDATFIIGYRGMVKLARQSGQIANIESRAVHKADTFEIEFGLAPKLLHRPCLDGEPGELVFVYAIATFVDGGKQVDVMSRAEVDRIRSRSKAGGSGPWVTDYEEMAKKTVLRRLCKMLPLSPELAKAIENENLQAAGERVATDIDTTLFELSAAEEPTEQAPAKRTDALKRTLSAKAANGAGTVVEAPQPPPSSPREPGDDSEEDFTEEDYARAAGIQSGTGA
jgi:recombination protein RecT